MSKFIPQDFWHGEKRMGRHFTPGILGGYYVDLIHKTKPFAGPKDINGVPLVRLGKNSSALHPVTVCQTALGWYEKWLDDPLEGSLLRFLELAEWLINNQIVQPQLGGVWPVPYGVPIYELPAGWISALVQGQAISVLARAYKVTQKEKYFIALKSAIVPLTISVNNGGVLRYWNNNLFFEEYPCKSGSFVLNGFISSLWGLYDALLVDEDVEIRTYYEAGVATLIKNIYMYDTGFWSRYSLFYHPGISNLASPYYHREHIEQLRAMNILTGRFILSSYVNRWENYSSNVINVFRTLIIKTVAKIHIRVTS